MSPPAQATTLQIAEHGEVLSLDYDGALAAHDGDSIWGVAVAFRVLQVAAETLSEHGLWDRTDLYLVSGHPGPGVRDALDYVTGCIRNNRFRLLPACDGPAVCSRDMRYQWWISDRRETVEVGLNDGFVPAELYEILDRKQARTPLPDDRKRFTELKAELAERIWQQPLSVNFQWRKRAPALARGEHPLL